MFFFFGLVLGGLAAAEGWAAEVDAAARNTALVERTSARPTEQFMYNIFLMLQMTDGHRRQATDLLMFRLRRFECQAPIAAQRFRI